MLWMLRNSSRWLLCSCIFSCGTLHNLPRGTTREVINACVFKLNSTASTSCFSWLFYILHYHMRDTSSLPFGQVTKTLKTKTEPALGLQSSLPTDSLVHRQKQTYLNLSTYRCFLDHELCLVKKWWEWKLKYNLLFQLFTISSNVYNLPRAFYPISWRFGFSTFSYFVFIDCSQSFFFSRILSRACFLF